ncbi:ATP-binding cassette domain-containing protein [Kineothrix sp. MB12-C1]|uniref:ATP-binding cassette domain-containing protein n=1 Tax=Kineothrix sp. MB12-C1 TaxID=3070215 RepID=UPI0027D2A4B6|nr:ATP-binding cassette domain-containing protein [Kineothrix sp. MB12-C1]WMC92327.1 ATP-binding cassette domain-containing protein [Kineothrix sp. MB12-C1]
MEYGIDTVIGEGESQLSFGQMQLLSLPRAIVTNPPILLLDELTSGLDGVTERTLLSAIRQVSSNRTIITISHRIFGIIDADTVNIMDAGKIVESGSPEELSSKEGWFAIYKRLEEHGRKVG